MAERRIVGPLVVAAGVGLAALTLAASTGENGVEVTVDPTCRSGALHGEPSACGDIDAMTPDVPTVISPTPVQPTTTGKMVK